MTTIGNTVTINGASGVTFRGRTWSVDPLPVWSGDTSQEAADYNARNIGTGKLVNIMAFTGIPYANSARNMPATLLPMTGAIVADSFHPAPLQISDEEESSVGRAEFGFDKPAYGWTQWGTTEEEFGVQHVNVFTRAVTPLKPVIVIIHGGAWVQNWIGNFTTFGHRLAVEGAVVVHIEYRLSTFGHCYIDGMESAGGYVTPSVALTDIKTALEWVQANIQYFGGDKNNVTLLGYSAGGEAIFTLMTSRSYDSLYTRAWPCCGGGGPYQNYTPEPNYGPNPGYKKLAARYKRVVEALAPYMPDETQPSRTVADAIAANGYLWAFRNALASDFISSISTQNMFPFVDGTFLSVPCAFEAARSGKMRDCPLIIDVCEDDVSILSTAYEQPGYARYLGYWNEIDFFNQPWMSGWSEPVTSAAMQENRRIMQLHAVFAAGAFGMAKMQKARGNAVYLNLFNYVSKGATPGARHTQNRMYMTGNVQGAVQGVADGQGVTVDQKVYAQDIKMADQYMRWLLAFAYTGNPMGSFTPASPGFSLFATPANLTLQQFNPASPGWNIIGDTAGTPMATNTPVAAAYNTTYMADAWAAYMNKLGVA